MKIKGLVINLEHREDRRNSVQSNIKKFWPELDYEFFSALTPDRIDQNIEKIFGLERDRKKIKEKDKARASCRLSHMIAAINFMKSQHFDNYDAVMVMEDDNGFQENVQNKIYNINFPQNWDMVFLTAKIIKSVPAKKPWRRVLKSKSTHS